MSGPEHPEPKRGCQSWVAGAVLGLVLLVLCLPVLARDIWLFELPYHLVAGCVLHAKRAFAHFATDLPGLMTAAVLPCLATAIALWGGHRLILWWRLSNGQNGTWHFKHTALAGSLVLLGSAAAIALSGVLHEAAWLPQGKVIQSNRSTIQMIALNNARHLGTLLIEYETDHGTRPLSLLDLETLTFDRSYLTRMVFLDLYSTHPPEPFVLVKPGKASDGDSDEIVLIGPQMPDRGNFVVLKSDMSVTTMPPAQYIEVLATARSTSEEEK